MEKFIFAKSSDSSEYFPDNKYYDFKIHLDRSINLQGYWKVGITEFFTTTSPTKTSMDKNQNPLPHLTENQFMCTQTFAAFRVFTDKNNLYCESFMRMLRTDGMINLIRFIIFLSEFQRYPIYIYI